MRKLRTLFDNNKRWAEGLTAKDPQYFSRSAGDQKPQYLWIGCADSRIPAEEILNLSPGELFVHRNVANLFLHTDFNCLSVLQYAVDCLKIKHIIVCGHYGCGGVAAAMGDAQLGLVDNWLRNIRDTYAKEREELENIADPTKRYDRLVELNVFHQVLNICHTTVVQNAWASQQELFVHGWVYDMHTGRLHDLDCCISALGQIEDVYRTQSLHL